MITVTARFDIIEGNEAEAEALIRKVAVAVSENEPGCLMYTWHRGVKEPLQILVFENWQDDEAIKAHREQPHMKELNAAFGKLFDPATVKITRWERLAGVER